MNNLKVTRNKILTLFILGIFLFSMTSVLGVIEYGETINLGTIKQGNNFTFSQTCIDATFITIAKLQLPDGTSKTINQNMTSTGSGSFEYNFTGNTQTGKYYIFGTSDGCITSFGNMYYEATPSGLVGTLGFYILILILSLGIILIGYNIEDPIVVVLGSFGLVLFGLFILFYGLDGIKDTVYTWGIGIITLMLGAYFGIRGSLEQLN